MCYHRAITVLSTCYLYTAMPRRMLCMNYLSIMIALSINYYYAIAIRWMCYKRAITVLSINELWPRLVLSICYRLAINTLSICECAPNVLSICYHHAIIALSICCECVAISLVRCSQFRSMHYWCTISVLSMCYEWFNRMLPMRYWTATKMLFICYVPPLHAINNISICYRYSLMNHQTAARVVAAHCNRGIYERPLCYQYAIASPAPFTDKIRTCYRCVINTLLICYQCAVAMLLKRYRHNNKMLLICDYYPPHAIGALSILC